MSNVKLEIPKSEQRKFERELKKFQKKNDKEFTHRVNQATVATQKMAQDKAPVDEGDLRKKIHLETSRNGLTGVVISKANYSAAVEYGTKPHMPPVNALKEWSRRKGIDPWAVAMSIKKKGTPAQPFLFPAWHKAQKDLLKGLRRVFK